MFEFRAPDHGLPLMAENKDVSALFDGGTVVSDTYVEDPATGTRLTKSGIIPFRDGGAYLLHWNGHTIGVEWGLAKHIVNTDDGPHEFHSKYLTRLGRPNVITHLPNYAFATRREHDAALQIATEAVLAFDSYWHHKPGRPLYIADPATFDQNPTDTTTWLTLEDYGYTNFTPWDFSPADSARTIERARNTDEPWAHMILRALGEEQ